MILDHPGRVTLKTEELFVVVLLSSTIREGDPARYTGASFLTLLAKEIPSFRNLHKCTIAILSKSIESQIQKYL